MTRLPDESIFLQNTTGDSGIENLYIYGKLNYDFKNDDITVKSLNVTGISSFTSDVSFEGDITLDEITARNANVTGVATVGTGLYLNGKLFDGDGDFGTAGQLLSSDGTDLNWIDASTTSVANANNVGTNANSTNADQFITFVGASSGNNPIRVNSNIKYNPSTNTLSQINIAGSSTAVNLNVTGDLTVGGKLKDGDGNFGTAGQVLSSDGTDTAWINAGSLTAGAAAEVGVSAASANANHFITMVDTASGNENIRVDTDLTYNPVTNTLNVPNISGNGSGLSGIEAFVTGMIILWYGNTGNIPTGFVLCDGNNNTPDLRDRFVVGAGSAYSPNNTGGSSSTTLSTSQLPSHNHSVSVSGTTGNPSPALTGDVRRISEGFRASGTASGVFTKVNDPNNPITGAASNSPVAGFTFDGTHTHTFSASGTSGNQGSGGSIENRPPYYALCYIMKT
jgi:microcystin-dependent protein